MRKRFQKNNYQKVPYVVRVEVNRALEEIQQRLDSTKRQEKRISMASEFKEVLSRSSRQPFVIHAFKETGEKEVRLSKITKVCKDKPILLLTEWNENIVVGRACVPKSVVLPDFTAEKWLEAVASVLGGEVKAPKGQDPDLICNFKVSGRFEPEVVGEALEVAQGLAATFSNAESVAKENT